MLAEFAQRAFSQLRGIKRLYRASYLDILSSGGFRDSVFRVLASFLSGDTGRFVAEVETVESETASIVEKRTHPAPAMGRGVFLRSCWMGATGIRSPFHGIRRQLQGSHPCLLASRPGFGPCVRTAATERLSCPAWQPVRVSEPVSARVAGLTAGPPTSPQLAPVPSRSRWNTRSERA